MLRKAYSFVRSDYLLRNSAIIAGAGLLIAALNYLFQLFAARLLTVEEYGVLGAVWALFYIASFSGQAISYFTTKNAALARKDSEKAYVLRHTLWVFTKLGVAFLFLFLVALPLIASLLHIKSSFVIIMTGVLITLSIIAAVVNGYARGFEDFLHPALAGMVNTSIKLIVGLGLVLFGFGVGGVLWGLLLASLFGISYLLVRYRRYVHNGVAALKIKFSRSEFVWYFFILFFSILFINADVLLVKHYFSEYDAGLYAALALLGKAVFFLSGAAAPVMFPRIVKHIDDGDAKGAKKLFWQAVGLTTLPALLAVIAYWLMPGFIVGVLYGNKYPVADLLVYMGLFIMLYSLLSVFVVVSLALERYKILYALILGTMAQFVLVYFFHDSLLSVILASIASLTLGLALTAFILLRGGFKKPLRRQKTK